MAQRPRADRVRRLAREFAKAASVRAGLHVRPYADRVQGLDAWRDIRLMLRGIARPTIFDVGANAGQSAARFAQFWPGAEIHSFEPSPSTFSKLQANVRGLDARVHAVNAGVGAESTRQVLLESSQSDMSSFLAPTDASWGETRQQTTVELVALDDYCGQSGVERIDVLKSDTQGYDLEVLRGASGLLGDGAIRLIFVEILFEALYERTPSFMAIYRFLADCGYRFVYLYDPFFTADGELSWCDALFAHQRK